MLYLLKNLIMKIVSVGTVAFDAIETPFGQTDKIVGGACTYISTCSSYNFISLTKWSFNGIKGYSSNTNNFHN